MHVNMLIGIFLHMHVLEMPSIQLLQEMVEIIPDTRCQSASVPACKSGDGPDGA